MSFETALATLQVPDPQSHKGQNGKVLLIGGSELFHAASRWSLEVVARMVDMVFYSSVPENNELLLQAKAEFWDGVVVPRGQVESYLTEADVILIGPGMTRDLDAYREHDSYPRPTPQAWEQDTFAITNYLLSTYPNKRWVIDAGALQMVVPSLLRASMIVTPHHAELSLLCSHAGISPDTDLAAISRELGGVTIVLKGQKDMISDGTRTEEVTGGNPGMTKGGTGDVLAGLIAGLYTKTADPFAAAIVGATVNKRAAQQLATQVGSYFTTTELAREIPKVLSTLL